MIEDSISINCVLLHFNRAIPESDYVTLGTIRYGVKLSQECIASNSSRCSSHAAQSPNSCASKSVANNNDNKCSSKNGSVCQMDDKHSHQCVQTSAVLLCDTDSDVNSVNGSCCLNATKCPLPWNRRLANTTDKQRKPTNESCKRPNYLTPKNLFFSFRKKQTSVQSLSSL